MLTMRPMLSMLPGGRSFSANLRFGSSVGVFFTDAGQASVFFVKLTPRDQLHMEGALRARLVAARVSLEGKTGRAATLISSANVDALAELVAREPGLTSISPSVRASLVDLAAQCDWQQDGLESVLNLLRMPERTGRKKRAELQKFFPALLSYFVEAEWLQLIPQDDQRAPAEEVASSAIK